MIDERALDEDDRQEIAENFRAVLNTLRNNVDLWIGPWSMYQKRVKKFKLAYGDVVTTSEVVDRLRISRYGDTIYIDRKTYRPARWWERTYHRLQTDLAIEYDGRVWIYKSDEDVGLPVSVIYPADFEAYNELFESYTKEADLQRLRRMNNKDIVQLQELRRRTC